MFRCDGAKTGLWLLAAVVMLLGGHMHMANAVRDARVGKRDDTKSIEVTGGDAYRSKRLLLSTAAANFYHNDDRWPRRSIYCPADFIAAAQQPSSVIQVVSNIAQTLNNSTTDASGALVVAQGSAMAEAVAQTADGQQAVAVAYAAALCQPGQTQQAVSQAFAVAVFCNSTTGCETLVAARATAIANCSSSVGGDVYSYAYASSSAVAALIGHCMVAEPGVMAGITDFSLPRGLTAGLTWEQLRMFLPRFTHLSYLSCHSSMC